MKNKDYCTDISVIPQYGGSCWFNAILMATLYSEKSRKILSKEVRKWNKKNSFLMTLKHIFNNSYKPGIKEFFTKIKPDTILLKLMAKYDQELLKKLQMIIKKYGIFNFGWQTIYIIKFLKLLNIKCLDIIYSNETDLCILNYDKYISYDVSKKNNKIINNIVGKPETKTKLDEENEIKGILQDVPDYLILSHTSLDNRAKIYARNWFNSPNKNSFLSSTFNIKTEDIKTYKEIITFNGHKYKLDSCLLSSYLQKNGQGHAIVGIHCNGNKYVYNGWDSNIIRTNIVSPCALMPYEWNLNNTDSFCLNVKQCKLTFIKKDKGLCFSFGKGNRLLIYVRIIEDKVDNKEISDDYKSLSHLNTIIKNTYNIQKYNKAELIRHLKKLNYLNVEGKTIEELRNILQSFINKYYNVDIKETVKKPAKDIKETVKKPAKDIKETVKKPAKDIKETVKKPAKDIKETVKKPAKDIKETVKKPAKDIKKPAKETKLSLIEKIKTIKPDIKNLNAKKKEELYEIYNKLQDGNYKKSPKETKLSLIEKIKTIKPDIKNLNAKKKEELLILYIKLKK